MLYGLRAVCGVMLQSCFGNQQGLGFFGKIAEIAEDQGHHPDLHLVGYHDVTIEMWTHTTNGLSINDFIVAYLIDKLDTPPSPQQS